MNVLVVGAGVVGTVYGAQLAKDGHTVDVLAHGSRTSQIDQVGLRARDITAGGALEQVTVTVVAGTSARLYDLVLVAVWADQIPTVCNFLRSLSGSPLALFFGNNPAGRHGLPGDLAGTAHLGFPGIGGTLQGDIVEYMRIPQQPTTLEGGGGSAVAAFEATMTRSGFPVVRSADMDGWLAYHGVFVASVAFALYRCKGNATLLAASRPTLALMCRSIEEGFAALARRGIGGAPRNLRTLHRPPLRPFAVWYWARTMRSAMGEHCFAAHARHAEPEMRSLAGAALTVVEGDRRADHMRRLLTRA